MLPSKCIFVDVTRHNSRRNPASSPHLWIGSAALAALVAATLSGWFLVRQIRFENARHERLQQLGTVAGSLRQNGLSNLRAASRDMAKQAAAYLAGDASASGPTLARLEGDASIIGADMAFLLDATGSVRMRIQMPGEPDIQGSTLAFRRYFQKAKRGEEDEFGALGTYTKKRGIYASTPVRNAKGGILGAAVFRLAGTDIEERWLAQSPDPLALIAPEGIVFASNEPSWRLRATSDSAAKRLSLSRQFGDTIRPIGFDLSRESVEWSGRRHVVLGMDLPDGWRIVSLLPSDATCPLTRSQLGAAWAIIAAWLFLLALGLVAYASAKRIRRGESEKLQLSRRLEEAERLEALGRLAGGVAHDFNNVLTAIIGYASVLEYKLAQDSTERDLTRRIGAAAKRASETVRQLMAFARRSGLQAKPISLHDLLKEISDTLGRTLPANISVQSATQAPHDVVIADLAHLRPALEHLARNSIEAMPNGGTLTFSTSLVETGSGQMLELRLTDNGKGIPPEMLPHLFEPFYSVSQDARGTGLGLASVWGTVQRMGGSIAVDSLVGKGTEFRIRFPLAPLGVAVERGGSPLAGGNAARRLRIVALDDDQHVRETLLLMLQSMGHQIETFATFSELWTRMKSGLSVDLLILDLQMPGMNGLDALKRLREAFPDLPVMTASGHYTTASMAELKALGVQVMLAKPFGALEMAPALEKAARRHRV
jgi:C4-dicarboxylate-specific signal transduction histidine kinase/ActR/RegA family two-component response regulator